MSKNNVESGLTAREWNRLLNRVTTAEARLAAASWPHPGHDEAHDELKIARKALKEAMATAPWGQSGAAFLQVWRGDMSASGRTHRRLSINGRLRATVDKHGWLEVFSASAAEEAYQAERRERREGQPAYLEQLDSVGELLWEHDVFELGEADADPLWPVAGDWVYQSGQQGGYLQQLGTGYTVSAPGALRRARALVRDEGLCPIAPRPRPVRLPEEEVDNSW